MPKIKGRAMLPGVEKSELKALRPCQRSDPLLAAAIERIERMSMVALDYARWDSVHHVRRWSRNDDGIKALLASGQQLDIYFFEFGDKSRTRWRIVQRERVDGFFQSTLFDSVGMAELRAMVEASELWEASDGGAARPPSARGQPRL